VGNMELVRRTERERVAYLEGYRAGSKIAIDKLTELLAKIDRELLALGIEEARDVTEEIHTSPGGRGTA